MKNYILSEKDTEAVLDILVEQLEVPRSQLVPTAKIRADLGADSLAQIEITMAIEEHFHLSLPDEQVEAIVTVGDLFDALTQALATRDAVAS